MTRILIKAAALADVEQEVLVEDPYVLIEGDRIIEIGRSGEGAEPAPETAIFDYPGRYILPGLINCHVHTCLPSGGRPIDTVQTDELAVLRAAHNAGLELAGGVTSIRDCGDQNGVMFSLRAAIEEGLALGPRLFVCGPPLTVSGGHCHFWGGEVDGPEAIITAVRRLIHRGADFIKLMATGGGTPGTLPARAAYSVEELTAAATTAHQAGKPVAVHCRGVPGMVNAVAAGVDHIEHACFELPDGSLKFEPRLADRLAEAGIYVTPTIQLYRDLVEAFRRKKELGVISPEEEERLRLLPRSVEEKLKSLEGFQKAGVKIVAGNDAGLPHTGFGLFWRELEAMVLGGMTPLKAIVAATRTAAEAIGAADRIGSLKPGKQADLILVDEDPTVNISALAKVSLVMKAGKRYEPGSPETGREIRPLYSHPEAQQDG